MSPQLIAALMPSWLELPEEIRSPPATEAELEAFETVYGPIPAAFRVFLGHFGGGVVGAEWVDDIRQLSASHGRWRAEVEHWTMQDTFIIGWDGAGNPYGIHVPSGAVHVEDHNFGGVHRMAASFEEFLVAGLIAT